MERTYTLTIESEILRERLADDHVEALGCEVADRPRVVRAAVCRQRAEALVCAIEEREQVASFHDRCDLGPLCLAVVCAGGVVAAGLEDEDAMFGRGVQACHQRREVSCQCGGREVVIGLYLETGVEEERDVVAPGGRADVDFGGIGAGCLIWSCQGIMLFQESSPKPISTTTRYSLKSGNLDDC